MCTNESTGLFQAFLNEMAKKSVYVDVPKVKRDNAISTLIFTKHALKNKDEIAAFYSLSNLCYKFNEIYNDEYQLNTLEIDMVAFSTGIMSLLIKHYQQAEFIILMLIRKYHNPVFIYICGLIHQYQFKFDQALTIMQEALDLLSGHKNKNFFWPGTDILIVSSDVSFMKATIMRSIEEMMTLKEIPCEPGIPVFHVDVHLANEIHNKFSTKSKQASSQSLSNLIKYDVYNLIRAYVDDLIQFDSRNHFIDYKILVANMSRNVSHSSNQLDKKSLPPSSPETSAKAKSKGISMKHQCIQTKFPMKNVQTQAGSKTISHSTQTIQMDVVDHKKELEQLQGKLDMALAQQKLAEANVTTLEAKVEQLNNTLKDANMELKTLKKYIPYLQWDNNCMKKVQQEIIEANNKKDALYKELLLKEIQQNCEMRLHINKQFETKCHDIIATLRSIRYDLSDTTVPTIDECNKHLDDWERHLQSCLAEEEKLMNRQREVLKLVSDDLLQLVSLDSVPVVHRETTNLLHEYFPILAVSLIDCQNKLREKEKQEIGKGTRDTSPNLNPSTSTAGISSQEERNKKNKAPSISSETSNRSVTSFTSDDVIKNDSKKKMQSLCSYLNNKIPHKTEAEIMAALQSFRKQNNGKLSGMTVHYILFNVYKILDSRQSAWAAVESKFKSGWEGSEDMTCSICLDLFHGFPTMTLKCKHKFHAKCIRPWLSKNSICAICRVYVTLDEDFPPLH